MDSELKKKWTTALRSGKYKQTTKKLSGWVDGEQRFCCLGVLCDIVNPKGWFTNDKGLLHHEVPPEYLLGFSGNSSSFTYDLVGLNDRQRYTFSEIADWIDENINGNPVHEF